MDGATGLQGKKGGWGGDGRELRKGEKREGEVEEGRGGGGQGEKKKIIGEMEERGQEKRQLKGKGARRGQG